MGHVYKAVQWNRFKRSYDLTLLVGVLVFLAVFVIAALASLPKDQTIAPAQLAIRALGALSFGLLSLILAIGPLARLSSRYLPLLYNRRHLGVACFIVAWLHAALATIWYHGFSDSNPLVTLLTANPRYDSIGGFPFESLGVLALLIMFVMAATSHDFWNANLGPGLWKAIHMSVYLAYAALVGHVLLGAAQGEKGDAYGLVILAAAGFVAGLHLNVGFRDLQDQRAFTRLIEDGWLNAGPATTIPDARARIITPPKGERIAVFRDGAKIYALSNVCRHQGGPLGEGRIIDGCVTCPWHGFQYRPEDGASPPPYSEKIATYRTKIVKGAVLVDPDALPPGTAIAPSVMEGART